jgi:hypothetical protein
MSETLVFLAAGALSGISGAIGLRSTAARTAALVLAAISVSGAVIEVGTKWLLSASPHGGGLVSTLDPSDWLLKDYDLGYRPRPNIRVKATSTFNGKPVYDVTYSINSDGSRWTPPASPEADIYLFVGDSFMFGQGLRDEQTVPSQFAQNDGGELKAALFAAPGYGPNHFLRLIESGQTDASLKPSRVKAVITWIIPAHLARVTGDETWLGGSPRYSIHGGQPQFTGSFDAYRNSHPLAASGHWLAENFTFLSTIGGKQREELQARIFAALMLRLQKLVNEKYNAPLIVLYSWPDSSSPPNYGGFGDAQQRLVSILEDLRGRGLQLLEVNSLGFGLPNEQIMIPHDGHPSAFTDNLIAAKLRRHLFDHVSNARK